MELNFDKEMDALLRQTAQSGSVFSAANPQSAHLDADEISAFAENSFREKSRQRYMTHLADCEKCRKNLSSLIRLNAEAESKTATASERREVVSASPIPWYRKLFVFPNVAYTMGALVLVFSGIALYTVLQGVGGSRNAEVSQISEKQTGGKGMSSDGDATATESYSSNSSMMSNAASATNTTSNGSANSFNSAVPSAPTAAMNSNAAIARDEPAKDLRIETKSLAEQKAPEELAKPQNSAVAGAVPPPSPVAKEETYELDAEREKQIAQNSIARKRSDATPSAPQTVQPAPMATMRAADKNKKLGEANDDALLKPAETRSVGGKNFRRANNVWVDSAYRGQATTNVSRGTKEYKKLDSGLRGIAENLGGTVVVVWREKAYRIQ